MDKIFIKDLIARGIIGVNDCERKEPQEILINLTIFADTRCSLQADTLENCIDYDALAKKVLAHAETAATITVETLANDLAHICLEDKRIMKIVVRVEKPNAVRFVKSVGVEIERERDV